MFDLEQAVVKWRQQMLTAGIKSPVPLEELESHLREEIEWQMKLGSDSRQAFEVGIQQFGETSTLKKEFTRTTVKGYSISQKFVSGSLVTFSLASLVMLSLWLRRPIPDPATLASLFKSDKLSLLNLYNTFAGGAHRSDFALAYLALSLILTAVFAVLNFYFVKRPHQPHYV